MKNAEEIMLSTLIPIRLGVRMSVEAALRAIPILVRRMTQVSRRSTTAVMESIMRYVFETVRFPRWKAVCFMNSG